MASVCRGVLFAVLVSAMGANLHAQALYGSLVGNVTDETGAALPGRIGQHHPAGNEPRA